MMINTDHKGKTGHGKYAFRPLWEATEDDFAPNSNYWKRRMLGANNELIDHFGAEWVEGWIDANIDDQDTCRAIAEKEERYLHTLSLAGKPTQA